MHTHTFLHTYIHTGEAEHAVGPSGAWDRGIEAVENGKLLCQGHHHWQAVGSEHFHHAAMVGVVALVLNKPIHSRLRLIA